MGAWAVGGWVEGKLVLWDFMHLTPPKHPTPMHPTPMHHIHAPPMHGPVCLSTQTQIPPHLPDNISKTLYCYYIY